MKNLILIFVAVLGFMVLVPANAQPPYRAAPQNDAPKDGRDNKDVRDRRGPPPGLFPGGPQGPRPGGFHFGPPISLYKKASLLCENEAVKKHLSLTDEQIKKIKKLSTAAQDNIDKKRDDITDRLPPYKWTDKIKNDMKDKYPKYILELSDKFTNDLESVLDPKQMDMTRSMFFLFFNGLDGNDPIEISNFEALGLTDEQKNSMKKALDESEKKFSIIMQKMMQAGPDNPNVREHFDELIEIKEDECQNVKKLLTEEQSEKGKKIITDGERLKESILKEFWDNRYDRNKPQDGPPVRPPAQDDNRGPRR